MLPKLKLRAGEGGLLLAVFFACVLLLAGLALLDVDTIAIMLTCSAVLVVGGFCLPYFHPERLVGGDSLERPAPKSWGESGAGVRMVTANERTTKPVCWTSENRRNDGLRDPLLDEAVERIIRTIDRDLEVRK